MLSRLNCWQRPVSTLIRTLHNQVKVSDVKRADDVFERESLEKMSTQYPNYYAKINLHNFPFTVSRHDYIITHRINSVKVGDVIKLDRIREIGSPDFTVRGRPWVSGQFFEVLATVMEQGRGAERLIKQPKKRKGHRKLKMVEPLTTTLRIQDIKIKVPQ